jgi:hypothetical protein
LILARPKRIKVTHWLDGTIKVVDIYEDTATFEDFMISIENDFSLNESFRVYALTPPLFNWKTRCIVDITSFADVLSNMFRAPLNKRLRLYILPSDVSPESSPSHLKKNGNDETASTCSGGTNGSRSGQDDFKKRTRYRDHNQCVFCQFDGEPLYAGHILPYSSYKTDEAAWARFSISGINDTCNGLTLCWNCHQAFDNDLVCISPSDGQLVVAQTLQEIESAKWRMLHGRRVTSSSLQWPPAALLQYRVDVMNEKVKERQLNREKYPYRCQECHAGCKSLVGFLNRHAGSEKCASKLGEMSSYSTSGKIAQVIDDEEVIFD